jgi:17beta-estradiol 17-dehydrogenase / very-long-chain 3-oxoacyl-CoA reductase
VCSLPPPLSQTTKSAPRTAAKYPSVKTQIHAIDFSSSTADYAGLKTALDPLDVGVLSAYNRFAPNLLC